MNTDATINEFVAYIERKWAGGTGHTPNNRWVSHTELRKHAEAFAEEQAIQRQADEQCEFDPAALAAAETSEEQS